MAYSTFLTDPFFDDFFHPANSRREHGPDHMPVHCDIKEYNDRFDIEAELPGYTKDDLKLSLDDGVLTIEASKDESKDIKDDNGRYIRRERFSGTIRRSFGVAANVTQEDITASFKDGILTVSIAKKDVTVEKKQNYIAIEG